MNANKITLNNKILIDLTQDTVTEEDVAEGKVFHKADGSSAVGTAKGGSEDLNDVLTEQEGLLVELKATLNDKASGGGSGGGGEPLDLCIEDGHAEVNLPNATKIKQYAFYNDSTLVSVTMPKVTSIGSYAFNACTKLELTELPSGVTYIGSRAFERCYKLTLTELPNGVTNINSYTFYSCSALALTELPSGVTDIGAYAFSGCSGLTSLTFKGTPESVASNAFSRCSDLRTINVPWAEGAVENAPWGATNATINYNYTGE